MKVIYCNLCGGRGKYNFFTNLFFIYKIDIFINKMYLKQNMENKTNLSVPVNVQVTHGACGAYAESLKMILQHVADFHLIVVDIISEKYKIPVNEIMNTVTTDSRYINMVVDPDIHRLTSNLETITSNSKPEVIDIKDDVIKKQSISESVIIPANKKKIKIKKI